MQPQRAPDYTKDTERFVLDQKIAPEQETYTGQERRVASRRKDGDRRVNARFNLTKPDRRKNVGRRAEDLLPDFW